MTPTKIPTNPQDSSPGNAPGGITESFNPTELCSRKLWEFVSETADHDTANPALAQAVQELATRRQYMEKLLASDRLAALMPRDENH